MLPSASHAARTHTQRKAVDTGVITYVLEIVIVKMYTETNPIKGLRHRYLLTMSHE